MTIHPLHCCFSPSALASSLRNPARKSIILPCVPLSAFFSLAILRVLSLVLLTASPVQADPEIDESVFKDQSLPEIIVREQADVSEPEGGQRFQRQQFEHYANLGEFLQHVNGLQLQSLGGIGDPVLVSMQGASASQTRLLVDGIPVNGAQYGGYDLNALALNQIEYIEVLANGDALDDGIGGTVEIHTRQGIQQNRVSAGLASWSTRQASADLLVHQHDDQQLSLLINHHQSANDYDYPVPSPYNAPTERGQLQALNHSAYRRQETQLLWQQAEHFHACFRLR